MKSPKIPLKRIVQIAVIAISVLSMIIGIAIDRQQSKKTEIDIEQFPAVKMAIPVPKLSGMFLMAATPVPFDFDTGLDADIPTYPDSFDWGELPEDHVEYLDGLEESQEELEESLPPYFSGDNPDGGFVISPPSGESPQDEQYEEINPQEESVTAGTANEYEENEQSEQIETASPGVTLSATTLEEINTTLKQLQFSITLLMSAAIVYIICKAVWPLFRGY